MNRKILLVASVALAVTATAAAVVPASIDPLPPPMTLQPELIAADDDWTPGPAAMQGGDPGAARTVNAMAEELFANSEELGETRALIVLQNGQPILERYGEGFGPETRLISWSMAKTVTAVLTGMLVAEGRLSLDDPAPVPAWQRPGDPRGAITLRHLLHMSSGLSHVEAGEPIWEADTVNMLFGEGAADMAAAAEAQPLAAQPNEVYNYSSATSIILSDIITRQLTPSDNPALRRDAMLRFINGRLAGPLGMTSMTPEFDERGTMIGGSIIHANARDWARFGEFLRRGGTTRGGQRLLPQSWMEFMLTPSSTQGDYGGHIWLNRRRRAGESGEIWPEYGPSNLFAALGHQGQFVLVSPSQRLTVVRLGISTDDQFPAIRVQLRQLMAAL
jgi:CubicO group peptidase (beta-lactamase class C family)